VRRVLSFASALVLALAAIAVPGASSAGAGGDEAATAAYLASIHGVPDKLQAFITALPKGADLHNHASGAVYAENYLAWARQDDGCYDPATLALSEPPCVAGTQPIAEGIARQPDFAKDVVAALSMANFAPTGPRAGHDHFFATFGKFGDIGSVHRSAVVAAATLDAARQHVDVLELMTSTGVPAVAALAQRFAPSFSAADLDASARALDAAGFAGAVDTAKKQMRDIEAGRLEMLHCKAATAPPIPACSVSVLYQYTVNRTAPAASVFAQARVAFAVASDPSTGVAGINFVAPEDDRIAVADYALHMRMVAYLHRAYPSVHISLHAGELTPLLVQPDALRDHIRQAVEVASAERIGHGVDVLGEKNAETLLAEMKAKQTLVEIALTSNDVILGVRGSAHPLEAYLAHGVPAAIVTDDAGVSRIDLSAEFLRAETTYGFDYGTLKRFARNSVEFAFLPGRSLWTDRTYERPVAACAAARAGDAADGACGAYLNANARAAAEFRLEGEFAGFEAQTARASRTP
jgi:hypothetical protein